MDNQQSVNKNVPCFLNKLDTSLCLGHELILFLFQKLGTYVMYIIYYVIYGTYYYTISTCSVDYRYLYLKSDQTNAY